MFFFPKEKIRAEGEKVEKPKLLILPITITIGSSLITEALKS